MLAALTPPAVLAADAAHIGRARHYRKLFGGGWRQAGLLAAAGLYAVRHHRERLLDDHAVAAELADGLASLGFEVDPPETNMVWCDAPPGLPPSAMEGAARVLASEHGVLIGGAYGGPRNPFGPTSRSMRFVTHMQTPRTAARALLGGLSRALRKG